MFKNWIAFHNWKLDEEETSFSVLLRLDKRQKTKKLKKTTQESRDTQKAHREIRKTQKFSE